MSTALLFARPFRAFFTLMTAQAVLSMAYWILAWSGLFPMPVITANPLLWHGHEMLFGFSAAAIAGFLLTAVASWTGRPLLAGTVLQILCGLWLLARLCWCWPSPAALLCAAAFDMAFGLMLTVVFAGEIIAAKNRRNAKIAAVLLVYIGINAGFYHALWTGSSNPSRWLAAALYLVVFLITLIGGRIIPQFTANWLRRQPKENESDGTLPPMFNRLDLFIEIATLLFMATALMQATPAGILGIVAGALQLIRVLRWRGWRAWREPLLWSLHLGYAWIGIGLILQGVALITPMPASVGLHALTVGAIAGLIIAVAGRVSLGHSGLELTSHPLLTTAFIAIHVAAMARVLTAFDPSIPLFPAAAAWLVAFVCFGAHQLPIWLERTGSDRAPAGR